MKMYLLSSVEMNSYTGQYEEVFYTVDSYSNLVQLDSKDWTQAFDGSILASLDNNIYSKLNQGKVYVNEDADTEAAISSNGGGKIESTDLTAITCNSPGLEKIKVNASEDTKFAISFDKRNTWYTRYSEEIMNAETVISSGNPVAIPVESNVAKGKYVLTPAAGREVKKLTMKLGQEGDTFPVHIDIIGYDGSGIQHAIESFYVKSSTSWDYNIIVPVSENFSYFELYFTRVKDEGETYTESTKPLTFHITNLNYVYSEGREPEKWISITENSIESRGMNKETIESLGKEEFDEIYDNTQLDYLVYLPTNQTFTSIEAEFMPSIDAEISFDFDCKYGIESEFEFSYDVIGKAETEFEFSFTLEGTLSDEFEISFDAMRITGTDFAFDFVIPATIETEMDFEFNILESQVTEIDFDFDSAKEIETELDFTFTPISSTFAEFSFRFYTGKQNPVLSTSSYFFFD